MGESLEAELREVIRVGISDAFDGVVHLRDLRSYRLQVPADNRADGTGVLRRILEQSLREWHLDPTSASQDSSEHTARDAMKALLALGIEGKRNRTLNGNGGLRDKAGKAYGVHDSQFHKVYETGVITSYAEWLQSWDERFRVDAATSNHLVVRWDDIESICGRVSRHIERTWEPDVVLTMSGPGSVAACYCMKIAPRDVPVVMAVTFPKKSPLSPLERSFQKASEKSGWTPLATEKWKVYLPNIISCFEPGSRIVLLDDRVITGDTQRIVKAYLEERSFEVFCCALFAPEVRRDLLDFIGRTIEGPFEMPWGDSRGRT